MVDTYHTSQAVPNPECFWDFTISVDETAGMYKKIINCREALSRSNGMGGELYNAAQTATYRSKK